MASLISSPLYVRKNLGGPFKESEHPRDHGQFAEKPGAKGEAKKPSSDKTKRAAPGSQLPEPQKNKLRDLGMTGTFPPADVPLSSIKFADLSKGADELKFVPLMSWNQNTGSGRVSRQYRYTQAFHDRNAAEKFDRVMEVEPTLPTAKKKLAETMASGSPREKEGAAIASIIMETGLRPTDSDESVKHGHYGVGSILAKHVTIEGDAAKLDFIGKEGVRNKAVISDANSVKYLKAAIAGAEPDSPVFSTATSQDALDQLKEATGLKDAKLKDLRTIRATQEARKVVDEFDGPPPPLSGDEKKDAKAVAKAILAMSGKVAVILNNTATMARDNYIHPEVFRQWEKKLTSDKTTKKMLRTTLFQLATTLKTITCEVSGKKPSESSLAKGLASSPLYRRKGLDFSEWDENKHSRDAGKFSSQPGAGAAPKQSSSASPGTAAPDAKTQGYVTQLKEKFGDQAIAKLQEMRAKVADDPAKVAAIDKIYAAMKPPSRQAANKEVATAQAGVAAAKFQLEAHKETTDKGRANFEDWGDKEHQKIIADRDAKIAEIKKKYDDIAMARKEKHEAKNKAKSPGMPSGLRASPLYKSFVESEHPRADDGEFGKGSGSSKPKTSRWNRMKQAAAKNESAKPAEAKPDEWHIDQIDKVSIGDVHENARKWNSQFNIPVTPAMTSAFLDALGKVDFGETGAVNLPMLHAASGLSKKQVVATAMALSKEGKINLGPSTGSLLAWRKKPEFALPGDAGLALVDGAGAPVDIVTKPGRKSLGISSPLSRG